MQVDAYRNRNRQFTVTIYDADGAIVPVTSSDIVYLKIGRNEESPVFELSSGADSSNGSSMTAANPTVIEIKKEDLATSTFYAGVYDLEVGFMDNSDNDDLKHAQKGTFILHRTMAGDDARAEFTG